MSLDEFYSLEEETAKGTAKLSATPLAKLDEAIIAKASEIKPAPSASLLFGEWVFVSGETDGDTFTAEEAGIESEISITGTDSDFTAKYFSTTEYTKSSLEAKLVISNEPVYVGCGNDEWSARLTVTKGTYSDEDEFRITLTDENTLLLQHIFPFDGALGVSYQTYKRK